MNLTQEQIDRMRSLEDADGRITPEQVVTDAKSKSSPLHSLFEWNKVKAAESHWLDCAREIIRTVKLVVTTEHYTIKAPHYVRDTSAKGQGYRSVSALKRDPAEARQSLIYTLEVAAGHLRRAFDIATALGLDAEIDSLLQEVAGVQRQLKQAA